MNNIICTDLHCDLLSYLIEASDADPMIAGRIGCTIPDLQLGNVKLQVMAIYTATESGSVNLALRQALWFQKLINQYEQYFDYFSKNTHQSIQQSNKINIISAIENAAGICEEKDTINQAFFNLENIISICGKPLYIGLTHHGENRFGGGNSTNYF
jgi:microsomal dipeptidase-like Zn-dependent dipeptidase